MVYDLADKAALLTELLSKPTGNYKSPAAPIPQTREVERNGDSLTVTVPESVMEEAAASVLEAEGLNPDEWEVTRFRRSEWGEGKVATRYEFKRTSRSQSMNKLSDAELDLIHHQTLGSGPVSMVTDGQGTMVVCIADTQFGKIESPSDVVLQATFDAINTAAYRVSLWNPERVVVAFLGDLIEGFVSQGGANAWRTQTPLSEQIRLARRTMIYAMQKFHETGIPFSMVAVPGNHDQGVRFGKGITRYDDSHDTEALIAVADAAKLSDRYKDIEFLVPETDELSVSMNLSDTHTVFTHGYMAKNGKYHEWVKGQAYNRNSLYHGCDVVFMGHWHAFHMSEDTDRTVIVAPAGERESTWFKHSNGAQGNPGVLLALLDSGKVLRTEILR